MATTTVKQRTGHLGFPVFLTAYDPSDLPRASLDPLGFERGYLHLADKILPGLTNVANRPRYFSVICAGAFLADIDLNDPSRLQYQRRLECILRFERFWAMANVLASLEADEDELPISGIRGVTYAKSAAETRLQADQRRVDANYQMLSRQLPYGVVGIYGAVADGMRFIDRKTFALTADLGEGFLIQTAAPASLKKAVREDGDVPLRQLLQWGIRAHIAGDMSAVESSCLQEALHRDPIRTRMATFLEACPFVDSSDDEMSRLRRILDQLDRNDVNRDLAEAVSAILVYEACFRIVLLGFERLLWLCKHLPAASIASADLHSDDVLTQVRELLPAAARDLGRVLDSAQTDLFRSDMVRLEDTRRFVDRAAASCHSRTAIGTTTPSS